MSQGNITQRSPGSWRLKYDIGQDPATGKRQTRYKTVRGSKRDAQRELRRLLKDVDDNRHVDVTKQTLGDYLDDWLKNHRTTVSPRTAERYGEMIENHIKPALGNVQLSQVTTARLDEFYAEKLESGRLDGKGGLSPQTVLHLDRLLHVVFDDARRQRRVAFNPVDDAKRPKVEKKAKQTLSTEEFVALLEKAEGGRLHAPILTILATGLRRGELLAFALASHQP